MRIIDADALKEKAREWIPPYNASVVINLFDLICNLADNMPTIDPAENGGCWGCQCALLGQAPVKHGKWIFDDFGFHCSECWTRYPSEITDELNYCPNCGAKMDGGEE